MIKEFNVGDRVHLVPKFHDTKYYTFGMLKEMPDPTYEATIKEKSVHGSVFKGKIAKKFDLPDTRYILDFIDYPNGNGWSYSIEMFKEFYDLNGIDPITLTALKIETTNTTENIPTNKDVLTESANNIESFTLKNNITIKF